MLLLGNCSVGLFLVGMYVLFCYFTQNHLLFFCVLAYYFSDQPVHLYDAYTGAVRATYRPFNAMDEMESPTVAIFSGNGQKILAAGFRTDRTIHIFDAAVPGRDSTILHLGKTRRSSDGQKGLVSALSFGGGGQQSDLCGWDVCTRLDLHLRF